MSLTDQGKAVDAIINVHPFHTVFCKAVHEMLPDARLIGTQRHHDEQPDLPWEASLIEDTGTQADFADTLEFSIPDGIALVTDDPDQSGIGQHFVNRFTKHRVKRVDVDDGIHRFALIGQRQKRCLPLVIQIICVEQQEASIWPLYQRHMRPDIDHLGDFERAAEIPEFGGKLHGVMSLVCGRGNRELCWQKDDRATKFPHR